MVQVEAIAASQKQLLQKPTCAWIRWVQNHLLVLLVLLAQPVLGGQIVKYLPGFDGELPFKLETGYISVDDSELFYYFIESEGNPQEDPLFLWLTGGPGCTSFSGLLYEVDSLEAVSLIQHPTEGHAEYNLVAQICQILGWNWTCHIFHGPREANQCPMEYDIDNYTGGLPKLKYYPYARTKTASMIFLDAPVGTGFSYARTPGGWPTSDTKSAEQSYQFLRKVSNTNRERLCMETRVLIVTYQPSYRPICIGIWWLVEHPQFLSVQLFVGGDSYAGLAVPLITKKIIDGNKEKAEPYMNIKGYLVGCPGTDSVIDGNSRVDFAHRMALISDEIYENAKRSCNENYINVDPANTACITAMGAIQKCLKDLSDKDILKPKCDLSSQDHPEGPDRRFLKEGSSEFLLSPSTFPKSWCTTLKLTHNSIWANDDGVQEALHVRKGTVPRWERCNNSLSYTKDVSSVIAVHKELSRSSLEVLVESGDHDISVPYMGTLKWIKSLNLTIVDDWRPWFVDNQVAGYTMKYSEEHGYHLTFATIKGAGHPAPEYYRRECYCLFDRTALSGWIVKTLPGFSGDLPFTLETGQGHSGVDLLILYLNGGLGCSGLNGLFYQSD
ncbi:unnamed protein product [Camellia sinensis]